MSVETILRNVYSYLEVLEATHSDVVRHWSEDSLENSLKWAHYCEQVLAYLSFIGGTPMSLRYRKKLAGDQPKDFNA